jgi:four helix bundle protein
MAEENQFVEAFKDRTKKFAIEVLKLCDEMPVNKTSTRTISSQLGRSADSTAANYRAACISRSDKDFYSKLSITIEEADESNLWLEIIEEGEFHSVLNKIEKLKNESEEIYKTLSKARTTLKNRLE